MDYKLVYYPNPSLREKAQPVREFGERIVTLANAMRQIMKDHQGMGLAAPQIGVSERIIIVEYPGEERGKGSIPFTVLVNPKITTQSKETDVLNEGCLSIPYVEVSIPRSLEVTITAQDPEGNPIKMKAKGLFARILQHEIDHIDGKLILDYDKKPDLAGSSERKPSVVVWGSTAFTVTILNTIRATMNVSHIVTEPAKPSGRDRTLTPTIVKQYADTLGIPTLEPSDLTDPHMHTYLLSCKADLFIVAAYGRLIPVSLYSIPHYGTLNVHPSLLPKYRGATPIQAAILAGDKKTGVTIMKLAAKFDTGDIVAQTPYKLEHTETYEQLEYDLAEIGGEVLNHIVPSYIRGELALMPQNELAASSTRKITPADRWLNLQSDPASLNERKVRAYAPEPSAFVILDGQPLKVLEAHIENDSLLFDTVQPAGKKPMAWKDFLNGYRNEITFDQLEDSAS